MIAPVYDDAQVRLFCGDARAVLAELPEASVDCAVTSPPYWRKRDYGIDGQYGLEERFGDYVLALRAVFAELRRALSDEGTFWLNLADSYTTSAPGPRTNPGTLKGTPNSRTTPQGFGAKTGLPAKNLVGVPWRVALALQGDGWILRSAIIWHKTNAMPESVRDRPSGRYEHLFLFTKQARYFFDLDAIRHPHPEQRHPGGNPGDVWPLATRPSRRGHPASYPIDIPLRAIAAGCVPGGTVLDPFSGSGTTLVAARQLRHAAIGIDLNLDYHAIAVDRLAREAAT